MSATERRARASTFTVRDPQFNFVTVFNRDTGAYLRTGILDAQGRDTGEEPFMASFPHILDVGIMGHCLHGLTGKCAEAGSQCYQSGGIKATPNMTLADYKSIVDQCAGRVHQFALGGRGDPELHEDFAEILAYTRDRGIVPNLTTSGFELDERRAALIKEHCGAAAVSWYGRPYTHRAIKLLVGMGVRTNIHFVLSRESIDEAIDMVANRRLPAGINRIIFLLFKPVGLGRPERVLSADDPRVRTLFAMLADRERTAIAGYDSCCIPAVINNAPGIDPRSYDTCEGGRFSAYITADLKMTPCSFDQTLQYGQDLRAVTIAQAWRSDAFERFRARLSGACPACPDRRLCLGGCPLVPEIVLCDRETRGNSGQDGSEIREVPH